MQLWLQEPWDGRYVYTKSTDGRRTSISFFFSAALSETASDCIESIISLPALYTRGVRTIRTHRNNDVQQLQTLVCAVARRQTALPSQLDGLEDRADFLVGWLSLALGRHNGNEQAALDYSSFELDTSSGNCFQPE